MGGPVPLGYELDDRKLVVNRPEAETVRHLFQRYTELQSVPQLIDELAAQGYRTKIRAYKDGRQIGGVAFRTGALSQLLKNSIYTGKVRHKDAIYDGEHDAIINQALFDEVQSIFAINRSENALGKKSSNPSLLAGLITDPDGRPMTPTHASTGSKRFRYYVTRLEPGDDKSGVWRLPSGEIERLVADTLAKAIANTSPASGEATIIQDQMAAKSEIANRLQNAAIHEKRKILLDQKVRVQVQKEQVIISFQTADEPKSTEVCIDAKLAKQGSELKFTIPPTNVNIKPAPNTTLQKLVAQAFAAQDLLLTGQANPALSDYSRRYLGQLVRISWLAPDIIGAIMDGTQPVDLTGRKLTRANAIPLDWPSQRKMFGFA